MSQTQDPTPTPPKPREPADRSAWNDDPLLAPGALDRLVDQLLRHWREADAGKIGVVAVDPLFRQPGVEPADDPSAVART